MTKIKTLSIITVLLVAVSAPLFAEEGAGSRGERESIRSIDNERAVPNAGIRNGEASQPGDFAETGGLSPADRHNDPTGEVDPGTSNSPAGNAGGE